MTYICNNWLPQKTTHTLPTLGCPKFLELYPDYYHITDQASKKDKPSYKPACMQGEGRWRNHCPNMQDEITTLTGSAAQLASKNISMSKPVYMHAGIATPELVANHWSENGLDHLRIVEWPPTHIIFPSSCSSQYSPWRVIRQVWTAFKCKYNIQ